MTHIVGGYPTMDECEQIALTMAKSGVSFIEIQIPFSDPVADGTTIMKANQIALKNGTTPQDCLELMKRLKSHKGMPPLLFMSYYNILYKYELEKFCWDAAEAGAYGLIVPDIPVDEEKHEHYLENCKKNGLHPIQVISPITPERRLNKIAAVASGFVYCVARAGTTGESRNASIIKLEGYLQKVRRFIKTPLAVGFGISTPKNVEEVLQHADIAVIGSRIIEYVSDLSEDRENKLQSFLKTFYF